MDSASALISPTPCVAALWVVRPTILRHPHGLRLGVEPARPAPTRSSPLPKRNYGFEKRQKEIRRQAKKEAKKQKKLDRAKESADTVSQNGGAAGDESPPR